MPRIHILPHNYGLGKGKDSLHNISSECVSWFEDLCLPTPKRCGLITLWYLVIVFTASMLPVWGKEPPSPRSSITQEYRWTIFRPGWNMCIVWIKKKSNLSLIQLCELYQNYSYNCSCIFPEESGHDSDKLGASSHSPPRTRSSHQSISLTSRTPCGGTWQCPEHPNIPKTELE